MKNSDDKMNINVNEFFTTHLPRALSSTNSLDGKYFQLDDSNEGNKIIIWNNNNKKTVSQKI